MNSTEANGVCHHMFIPLSLHSLDVALSLYRRIERGLRMLGYEVLPGPQVLKFAMTVPGRAWGWLFRSGSQCRGSGQTLGRLGRGTGTEVGERFWLLGQAGMRFNFNFRCLQPVPQGDSGVVKTGPAAPCGLGLGVRESSWQALLPGRGQICTVGGRRPACSSRWAAMPCKTMPRLVVKSPRGWV